MFIFCLRVLVLLLRVRFALCFWETIIKIYLLVCFSSSSSSPSPHGFVKKYIYITLYVQESNAMFRVPVRTYPRPIRRATRLDRHHQTIRTHPPTHTRTRAYGGGALCFMNGRAEASGEIERSGWWCTPPGPAHLPRGRGRSGRRFWCEPP